MREETSGAAAILQTLGVPSAGNGEVIFGTPRLSNAWLAAVTAHPLAYLRHRASHFWRLISGENLTFEIHQLDVPGPAPLILANKPK